LSKNIVARIESVAGWLLRLEAITLILFLVLSWFAMLVFGARSVNGEWASILGVSLASAVNVGLIFGWPLSVSHRLVKKRFPEESDIVKGGSVAFGTILISAFFGPMANQILLGAEIRFAFDNSIFEFLFVLIILVSAIFILWNAARLLVSAELSRPAKISESAYTLVMFFALPVCVFRLRSRLKALKVVSNN
jgi:hypothetical protein